MNQAIKAFSRVVNETFKFRVKQESFRWSLIDIEASIIKVRFVEEKGEKLYVLYFSSDSNTLLFKVTEEEMYTDYLYDNIPYILDDMQLCLGIEQHNKFN